MPKKQNQYDAGKYRLSGIDIHGLTLKHQFTSWQKAHSTYTQLVRSGEYAYLRLMDIGDDDPRYWTVREERTLNTLRTFEDP